VAAQSEIQNEPELHVTIPGENEPHDLLTVHQPVDNRVIIIVIPITHHHNNLVVIFDRGWGVRLGVDDDRAESRRRLQCYVRVIKVGTVEALSELEFLRVEESRFVGLLAIIGGDGQGMRTQP
jgi:hypothetical protein